MTAPRFHLQKLQYPGPIVLMTLANNTGSAATYLTKSVVYSKVKYLDSKSSRGYETACRPSA